MADSAQTPATGGGEAPAELPELKLEAPALDTATPVPEKKPLDGTVLAEEAKPAELGQIASEVKPTEANAPVPEVKLSEPVLEEKPTEAPEVKPTEINASPAEETKGDWQQREAELLKKIEELETVKSEAGADGLKLELKVRVEEIDILKARVKNLETELQAALSKPGAKNHEMIENIKQQHEELLSKARGMIFDKTKMVKNQELQIEALNTQVQSLKDINIITKDLLEIRNSECKTMEDRLQAMEARFKAEKERFGLVMKKTETGTALNDDLKKEYETQLGLFKELRVKYEERVQALVSENAKLKELRAAQAEAAKGSSS